MPQYFSRFNRKVHFGEGSRTIDEDDVQRLALLAAVQILSPWLLNAARATTDSGT
jgi:hypothetical protein